MKAERQRYSLDELVEFESLLRAKLDSAKDELSQIKGSILQKSDVGDDSGKVRSLDDGADSFEKEYLNQLAARTQKYIIQIENALVRVKNGTYGICIDTGKLISKERLRAVPHTQHSIEAKLNRN